MRLTLVYSGDNQGYTFPPVNLLMIANEFRKYGVKVDIIRDETDFDYYGIPSDNIFNDEYSDVLNLLETVSGEPINFSKLQADIEEVDFDIPAVLTSLGCVYKCKYCPHKDIAYKPREISIVLNELENACKYSYFEFLDNNVMADKARFFSIIDCIPSDVKWGALMNINDYSDSDLQYMYDRGLRNIYLGLESFNENDLDYFGKTYHYVVNSKDFLERLREIGFNVLVFIIRGLPNETEEGWNDMVKWLELNEVYYTIGHFHDKGELINHPVYSPEEYSKVIAIDTAISKFNFTNFIQNTLN